MEHEAALLLIVGCSQDMKLCEELPAPMPVYEISGERDVGLSAALRDLAGSRPRVMGTRVDADPAMEEQNAVPVWYRTPEGALRATVEAITMKMASCGRTAFTSEQPNLANSGMRPDLHSQRV